MYTKKAYKRLKSSGVAIAMWVKSTHIADGANVCLADWYGMVCSAWFLRKNYTTDDLIRLWPYRVTQQKVARSWSTQVDLMERYPEHRFVASQAQQFKWLEQVHRFCAFHNRLSVLILFSCTLPCSSVSKQKFILDSSTRSADLGLRTTRTCLRVRLWPGRWFSDSDTSSLALGSVVIQLGYPIPSGWRERCHS